MNDCRLAGIGALLLLLSCGPEPQFPTYTPEQGNPALLTADDIAVYEAVISGYAQAGQILLSRAAPGPPPGKPITESELERMTAQHGVRVRPATAKAWDVVPAEDRWRAMDGRTLEPLLVPHSAVKDFGERNRRKASLKAFRPKHLRIEWSDTMETMRCLYTFTLPGYSLSRDAAVVEISCGMWALAGGGEVVYLKRIGGQWRAVAKQGTWIS